MGNRRRNEPGGTETTERSPDTITVTRLELPAGPPASHGGNGSSPCHPCGQADLDAYIQRLVDAAPPLTAGQRDTLALLLRRPRRR